MLNTDDIWTAIDGDDAIRIHHLSKDGLDLGKSAMYKHVRQKGLVKFDKMR